MATQDPLAPEPTEEHRIGALVLAVASLSARGYVKMHRPTSAGWRVTVYSPRAEEEHRALMVTRDTLRDALEAAWALLRETTKKKRRTQP